MKRNTRDRKKLVIFMLMFSIASLSIGFAAFTTTLNISSSASVTPNSDNFKVRFSTSPDSLVEDKVVPTTGPGIASASNATINNSITPTVGNIAITFTGPGFAEYVVYVRNVGAYTAYLNTINFNGEKECEAVGEATPELVGKACEALRYSVRISNGSGFTESSSLENMPLEKNGSMKISMFFSYDVDGALSDGPFSVKFPEISLTYSTINQPGYTPSIMGSDDIGGTLNSKIKADTLFKGTDANVDFAQTPETGVYVRSGTENHVNPIYYYRGAVTNNNVLFAGKCWKIVRTTETGGTKLIYNGTPTADNKCNGDNSMIGYSAYNDNYDSEDDVSYIYSDGTNSTIKQKVDTWYTSNMTAYTDMLEDTVWCNDRSITFSGYYDKWGYDATLFGAYARNATSGQYQPSLHCPAEYSLTTSATQVSNKLTYPVGLLTADELTLAGMGWGGYTEDVYLNNYYDWWTMSPYAFGYDYALVFAGYSYGCLNYDDANYEDGVRPAVSLKPGAYVSTGNGTASSPYVIE